MLADLGTYQNAFGAMRAFFGLFLIKLLCAFETTGNDKANRP